MYNNREIISNVLNQTVVGTTLKKDSIIYSKPTIIKTSGITSSLDSAPEGDQTYTFGQANQQMIIAGGANHCVFIGGNSGVSSTSLNVTSVQYGTISVGMRITGTGITGGTIITSVPSGATGSYTMSIANAVANSTVISGFGGNFAYSYDAITWNQIRLSIFDICYSIGFNGNMWIAVGQRVSPSSNTIAYSYNGINWTSLTVSGSIFTTSGRKIVWNGELWVAVGSHSTASNNIIYSYDGLNWTGVSTTIFGGTAYDICWSGTRFVAVGTTSSGGLNTIAYSNDGISWTGLGVTIFSVSGRGVCWSGTRFIAVGEGSTNTIAFSNDGISWTGVGKLLLNTICNSVSWNGDKFIACGQHLATITASITAATASSPSILNVTAVSGGPITLNMLITGTSVTAGTRIYSFGSGIGGVGTYYLTLSSTVASSTLGGYGPTIISSTDGLNWSNIETSQSQIFATSWVGNRWITSITWVGNRWISGSNSIFTFTGGTGGVSSTTLAVTVISQPIYVGTIITGTGISAGTTITAVPATGLIGNYTMSTANTIAAGTIITGIDINSASYSVDGENWIGLGRRVLTQCFTICNNNIKPNTITYQKSIVIAVGRGGNTIVYSHDNGVTWSNVGVSSPFSTAVYGICFNGNVWVAVGGLGGNNTIGYSYDGIVWTGLDITIFSSFGNSVKWNGDMFVALGNGTNSIAYSYDGIYWTGVQNSTNIFITGNSLTWTGKKWVAVGNGTFSIAYSSDGKNWTGVQNSLSIFSIQGNDIVWNGSRLVSVGSGGNTIAYSDDGGNTWFGLGTSSFTIGNGVDWNQGTFVAVGKTGNSGPICYSYDGITWISINSLSQPFGAGNGRKVKWCRNRWVSVGGTQSVSNTVSIAYSLDAINWTTAQNMFTYSAYDLFWNSNLGSNYIQHPIIVAGDISTCLNTLVYSGDGGLTWQGLGKTIFSTACYTIFWNGNIWLVGGTGTNSLAYSYDGLNFIGLGVETQTNPFLICRNVFYNGSIWVGVGSNSSTGIIAYSYDGINWITASTTIFTTAGFKSYWNGVSWISVGSSNFGLIGSIAYSNDGISWSAGTSPLQGPLYTVIWANSLWLIGGENGGLVYSSDGTNWTTVSPSPLTSSIQEISWNGKRFVMVGSGTGATAAYSNNGTTWTTITNIFSGVGRGICWDGKKWIAGGREKCTFNVTSISGTTLTVSSVISGNIMIGMTISGTGITAGTTIISGSGLIWTVSISYATPIGTITDVTGNTGSIYYSYDGIVWTLSSSNIFSSPNSGSDIGSRAGAVASNSRIGPVIFDSQLVLNKNGYGLNSQLDLFSDIYYNTGYTNLTTTIKSSGLD